MKTSNIYSQINLSVTVPVTNDFSFSIHVYGMFVPLLQFHVYHLTKLSSSLQQTSSTISQPEFRPAAPLYLCTIDQIQYVQSLTKILYNGMNINIRYTINKNYRNN